MAGVLSCPGVRDEMGLFNRSKMGGYSGYFIILHNLFRREAPEGPEGLRKGMRTRGRVLLNHTNSHGATHGATHTRPYSLPHFHHLPAIFRVMLTFPKKGRFLTFQTILYPTFLVILPRFPVANVCHTTHTFVFHHSDRSFFACYFAFLSFY